MKRTIALAGALALILVACGDPNTSASADPTDSAWLLASGTVDDQEIPILDEHPITLVFEDDQAGGTAACNQYFGGYTIEGDDISFGDIGQTMMACMPDEVMTAESLYLDSMARVTSFTATDSDLTLRGDGVELIFTVDTTTTS